MRVGLTTHYSLPLSNRWARVLGCSRIQQPSGPLVQPGVDATLSRWRSPVRIRYGSLLWCGTPTAERPVLETGVCEFESRPHYSIYKAMACECDG